MIKICGYCFQSLRLQAIPLFKTQKYNQNKVHKYCSHVLPVNFEQAFTHLVRGHLFSTYAKFSEKLTFLTPWYAHVCARIKGWSLKLYFDLMFSATFYYKPHFLQSNSSLKQEKQIKLLIKPWTRNPALTNF